MKITQKQTETAYTILIVVSLFALVFTVLAVFNQFINPIF